MTMTGIKLAIFSAAAGSLPIAQMMVPADLTSTARTIEQSTPTFVLALICIIFAGTIVALYRQLVKTSERHHEEWAKRETALAEEREARHRQMLDMTEKMTAAFTGVKTIIEKCHDRSPR